MNQNLNLKKKRFRDHDLLKRNSLVSTQIKQIYLLKKGLKMSSGISWEITDRITNKKVYLV